MRCPSCGTENAPDSRFCGGCGARLEPSRVAPTVKLPDAPPASQVPTPVPGAMRLPTPAPGAMRLPTPAPGSLNSIGNLPTPAPGALSYPPNARVGSIPPTNGPASIPPTNNPASYGPASIPPTNNPASYGPASIPPTNNPASRPSHPPASMPQSSPGTVQRRASTPAPVAMSSPSLSMAPPRHNTAAIAILLVIDLGLAAAGATMLVKGLAKPAHTAAPTQKAEQHTEAAAPAPTRVAVAPAPPPPEATVTPAPAPAPAPEKKLAARDPHKDAKKSPVAASPAAPLDPYNGAPPADESQDVERMAAQSFGAFRSCVNSAIQTQPIHGMIRIAFQIQADGHVDHVQPVVNETHSDSLGQCLAQTIATWTLSPHSGPALSYERTFSYP